MSGIVYSETDHDPGRDGELLEGDETSPDFRRSDFSVVIGDIDRDDKSLRGGAFSLTELSVDVRSI